RQPYEGGCNAETLGSGRRLRGGSTDALDVPFDLRSAGFIQCKIPSPTGDLVVTPAHIRRRTDAPRPLESTFTRLSPCSQMNFSQGMERFGFDRFTASCAQAFPRSSEAV